MGGFASVLRPGAFPRRGSARASRAVFRALAEHISPNRRSRLLTEDGRCARGFFKSCAGARKTRTRGACAPQSKYALSGSGTRGFALFAACALGVLLLFASAAQASIALKISPNSTVRGGGEIEADYSSTHLFIDEINGDTIPITIFFDPGTLGVDEADVFTNLNNRDKANLDANGDGIPDAIVLPNGNYILAGDTANYFTAYRMTGVSGGYQTTIYASKTGAYRITARYHLSGEGANTWHWYSDFMNGGGTYHFRDAAIVVSPTKARSMNMYELNVLAVDAEAPTIINPGGAQTVQTTTDYSKRSTFVDLYGGPGATTIRPWNLTYAQNLGVNWLWLQPVHPIGIQGRQNDPNNGSQPFSVGSPYAVKNFFAINPLMSKSYVPGTTSEADGRAAALAEFQGFVSAADAKGINVMLDVPFNHTAYDCELDAAGQALFGNAGTSGTSQFWNVEARVYSRWNGGGLDQTNSANYGYLDYGQRAYSAWSIALAADRYDFGKFSDVHDIYFGHYAALVDNNTTDLNSYKNEGDWFDYSIGSDDYDAEANSGNGHFDGITQNVWKYFAGYIPYWLSKTGHTDAFGNLAGNSTNPDPVARRAEDDRGLDGIRADFAQGLPPQLWEYIINYARSYKWDFVFLAESLDGGEVTRRSGRHFDVLNENVIFAYYSAQYASDYRNIYDGRRNTYGQAMVLWDTQSHDEAGYADPYLALVRYACSCTIDGAPDIFYGQEIGIAGAVVPTGSDPVAQPYGFSLYQVNFGKPIPQFMTYNSLVPAWNALGASAYGQAELYPVYSAIGRARIGSPALQSSNRYYLNDMGNNTPGSIFGVAKYATANASPNASDVVLGFVNLDRNNQQIATFNVNITQNSSNLFGIDPSRTYNVKNIAADTAHDANRGNVFLWANGGRTGSDILANGVYVALNPVPSGTAGWLSAPYEAQYLRVYDVTAPVSPPATVSAPNTYNYALGNSATFSWPTVAADSKGIVPAYSVTITINGTVAQTVSTSGTTYTVTNLAPGQHVSVSVASTNPYDTQAASPTSTTGPTIKMLDPAADEDGDGVSNAAEDIAGTNPLDNTDYFHVTGVSTTGSNSVQITWSSKPGKQYQVESTTSLGVSFTPVGPVTPSAGGTTSYTDSPVSGSRKFYHIKVVQ